MIRRALERVVERHLQTEGARGPDEAAEVLQGPQLGIHPRVASVLVADGPGAPRVVGPGDQRVVGTLAVGPADRMNRGQIDDVETQRRDAVEGAFGVTEGAVALGIAGGGSREELVPGGESGLAAIGAGLAAIGVGTIFGMYLQGALRNPEADAKMGGRLIFGFAVTEALGLIAAVVALALAFS